MNKTYRSYIGVIFFFLVMKVISGQSTIEVQAFNFNSSSKKDTIVEFPQTGNSYEKIWMKYTMRCKNGLVSTGTDRNKGCGEWDYSCNTFITDSSKVDSTVASAPSHIISSYADAIFPAVFDPTYSTYKYTQKEVTATIISESIIQLNNGTLDLDQISSDHVGSLKAYYLFTKEELQSISGAINGLQFDINGTGTVDFLRIRMKNTSITSLTSQELSTSNANMSEVYFSNTSINVSPFKAYFHTPFNISPSMNVLVEVTFEKKKNDFQFVAKGSKSDFISSAVSSGRDRYLHMNNTFSLDIPATKATNQINKEITIGFWAKGDGGALPTNTVIIEGVDAANNRQINVHLPWSNSNIYWDCGNDGSGYDRINKLAIASEIKANWNYWTFTKNATTGSMKIYLNGVLWHEGSGLKKAIDITKLKFGSNADGSLGYYGDIDDLTIWNKELDQNQIAKLMFENINESDPIYGNLLYQYNFDEEAGSHASDLSNSPEEAEFIQTPNRFSFSVKDQFKQYNFSELRPSIALLKGSYSLGVTNVSVLDSVQNVPYHVRSFYVENNDLKEGPSHDYWLAGDVFLYDEDGTVLGSEYIEEDSFIYIDQLTYFNKFPMKFELMSFVTPYGIGLDFGLDGKTWIFDVSDFEPILTGKKRMSIEFGGQNQEQLDISFDFVEGTPSRKVLDINQIWPVRAVGYASIISNAIYEKRKFIYNPQSKYAKIRCAISGHGQEGEFIPQTHYIDLNGGPKDFAWQVWKECADNAVYPQGGTWIYDRAGWCPGAPTDIQQFDVTNFLSAQSSDIDYGVLSAQGDSRYIVNAQMVEYGPASFVNDASISKIISPNDAIEFGRYNPSCMNPEIQIQNTGSETLTSLLITYKIDGSLDHQYQWTGNLPFMATTSIILPTIPTSIWEQNGTFIATASLPNGKVDQNAANNQAASNFRAVKNFESAIVIQLRTNTAANETSWMLTDADGNILKARNGGLLSNKLYSDTIYNLSGCYFLKVKDTDDDGISFWANNDGSGYVAIGNINGTKSQFNGDFGKLINYQFTAGDLVATNDITYVSELNVFPNPNDGRFTAQIQGLKDDANIEVRDMNGRIIKEFQHNGDKIFEAFDIDMTDCNSGIYIVLVHSKMGTKVQKFIKL